MEWGRGGKGKRKEEEKDGLKREGNGERWKEKGGKGGKEEKGEEREEEKKGKGGMRRESLPINHSTGCLL